MKKTAGHPVGTPVYPVDEIRKCSGGGCGPCPAAAPAGVIGVAAAAAVGVPPPTRARRNGACACASSRARASRSRQSCAADAVPPAPSPCRRSRGGATRPPCRRRAAVAAARASAAGGQGRRFGWGASPPPAPRTGCRLPHCTVWGASLSSPRAPHAGQRRRGRAGGGRAPHQLLVLRTAPCPTGGDASTGGGRVGGVPLGALFVAAWSCFVSLWFSFCHKLDVLCGPVPFTLNANARSPPPREPPAQNEHRSSGEPVTIAVGATEHVRSPVILTRRRAEIVTPALTTTFPPSMRTL